MALDTESLLIVTSKTGFSVIKGLDRVDLPEIRPMRLRHVIRPGCGCVQVTVYPASRVAV